jgi:hypothetical protein
MAGSGVSVRPAIISECQQSFEHHGLQSIQWARSRFIVPLRVFLKNLPERKGKQSGMWVLRFAIYQCD